MNTTTASKAIGATLVGSAARPVVSCCAKDPSATYPREDVISEATAFLVLSVLPTPIVVWLE